VAVQLVVEKSRRQRHIEGVLLIVLPPLTGAALRWGTGAGASNLLAVMAVFLLVSPLGSLVASFGPGERIAPEERMRRALARLAAKPFAVVAGWSWLTYSSVFLSALFSAGDEQYIRMLVGIVPYLLGATFLCAAMATFQCRRWYLRYDPAKPAERYASAGQWLKEQMPIQLACVSVGLAAGFIAAHLVTPNYTGITLGAGWLCGIAAEAVIASRILRKKPLLWSQLGFGSAALIGLARMGLNFAGFFVLFMLLEFPVSLRDEPLAPVAVAVMLVLAVVLGLLFGTVMTLAMWALARLGDLRARKTPAA
jgi:hypothetical protein